MKKIISLMLIGFTLSSCSLFRVHKMDVEQGNIITQDDLRQLQLGMTEPQVKSIMGTPVLINIFSKNRLDYIYTFQKAYGKKEETRVTLIFEHSRLQAILRN